VTTAGKVLLVLIPIPPLALIASLIALNGVRLESRRARERWQVVAWVSGVLSLGSVAVVVFIIYALAHLD